MGFNLVFNRVWYSSISCTNSLSQVGCCRSMTWDTILCPQTYSLASDRRWLEWIGIRTSDRFCCDLNCDDDWWCCCFSLHWSSLSCSAIASRRQANFQFTAVSYFHMSIDHCARARPPTAYQERHCRIFIPSPACYTSSNGSAHAPIRSCIINAFCRDDLSQPNSEISPALWTPKNRSHNTCLQANDGIDRIFRQGNQDSYDVAARGNYCPISVPRRSHQPRRRT